MVDFSLPVLLAKVRSPTGNLCVCVCVCVCVDRQAGVFVSYRHSPASVVTTDTASATIHFLSEFCSDDVAPWLPARAHSYAAAPC